ncbi:MAG: hypothetical protein OSB70_12995 [Myxococcota bacterium]|nr:hypothetical protein [Myxococcota bacterium]
MKNRCLIAIFFLLTPSVALGQQAYCSLRDPVRTIQSSVPDFDHYVSIVRQVHAGHRKVILESLPFTIHANELGTHTLYAAFDSNDDLAAIVHVRTERGRWGLTEIAWTFDPELRVIDMNFQRSRDSSRGYIESEDFQKLIQGKGFVELRALLNDEGTAVNEESLAVPPDAQALALNVIKSALKTISATQAVWGESLEKFQQKDGTL